VGAGDRESSAAAGIDGDEDEGAAAGVAGELREERHDPRADDRQAGEDRDHPVAVARRAGAGDEADLVVARGAGDRERARHPVVEGGRHRHDVALVAVGDPGFLQDQDVGVDLLARGHDVVERGVVAARAAAHVQVQAPQRQLRHGAPSLADRGR
jgi:hypothetical protein